MKTSEFNSFPANSTKKIVSLRNSWFLPNWAKNWTCNVWFCNIFARTFVNFRGRTFFHSIFIKKCSWTFVQGSLKWNVEKNTKNKPFLTPDRNQEIWQLTCPKMSKMSRKGNEWRKITDFTLILSKWGWNRFKLLEMIQTASVLLFQLCVHESSTKTSFPVLAAMHQFPGSLQMQTLWISY